MHVSAGARAGALQPPGVDAPVFQGIGPRVRTGPGAIVALVPRALEGDAGVPFSVDAATREDQDRDYPACFQARDEPRHTALSVDLHSGWANYAIRVK